MKRYPARIYLGTENGKERYEWLGRFNTKREAKLAVAKARLERERRQGGGYTVAEYAAMFLEEYERTRKSSSTRAARGRLRNLIADLGNRPIGKITRIEAKEWAAKQPVSQIPMAVTLFNAAIDDELIQTNPFRGLARVPKGRREQDPPTLEQFDELVKACSALGEYASHFRAFLLLGAYSGMRPGELAALEWGDVDFEAKRIRVRRRLYRGQVDLPKSNKERTIALTAPARDALLGVPREKQRIFRSPRGDGPLDEGARSRAWAIVKAKAELDFDFYLATKHFCVHYFYVRLNLPARVIAAQMGWSAKSTDEMLATYGHGEIGALEEVDAAFERNVVPLRSVRSDANQTQEG